MKKQYWFLASFLPAVCAAVFNACAALPTAIAPWAETPAAIRAAFPDEDYMAQRGRGKTRAAAEANAATEIARFLTREINATAGYRMASSESGGVSSETVETINEAYVKTQIDLFGIRYAEGAFYDKTQREWHAAAYIEREEAWRIYEPRFRQQADAFQSLFDVAETEADAFKKALRYGAALRYAESPNFVNTNLFGQLLYPTKMNEGFARVRSEIAVIPQRIDEAKRNAQVFIDCPGDFESLVGGALARAFQAEGFPVTQSRNTAAAVCAVTIDPGEQQRALGTFYYPSLRAVVSGNSGVLWTFNAKAEKSAAVTPDVAKRRAWTALAEEVISVFKTEFNANSAIL